MLRSLVLLLVLINAVLYLWLHSDARPLQAEREPQRLQRQVSPDAIQVLPDLPGGRGASGAAGAGPAASAVHIVETEPTPAASGGLASTSSDPHLVSSAFVHKTSESEIDCSETPPLDEAQLATLKQALAKAGLPPDAIAERRQSQGGSWIVFMGRFATPQAWQREADELKKLDVKFERVSTPAALSPGLSLGQFGSASEAAKRLDELTRHGVRNARVVTTVAPTIQRRLQVRSTDPAWHHAAGAQRFSACAIESASNP